VSLEGLVAALVGAVVAAALAAALRTARRPMAVNHRGAIIPLVLGWAVFGGLWIGMMAGGLVVFLGDEWPRYSVMAPLSLAIVFAAGVYDDVRGGIGRGLLGHLAELVRGRISPGIVKLVAAVVAAVVVALALDASGLRFVLGVLVMAGATNVWNLLDVRPGRCIKAFVPAIAVLLAVVDQPNATVIGAAALGAALAVLPFDLAERAMLGDAGSNLLGFVVGVGLFVALSTVGLAVAFAVILAIHVVSETVTLSRIIRRVPPLRWFDDLGRIRPTEPRNRDSEATSS
jgi:UDP-N-acetylmuramyl pentapeptide phosphotransferase/UDP-N-acetylglucosamine-1-phosphate transferase